MYSQDKMGRDITMTTPTWKGNDRLFMAELANFIRRNNKGKNNKNSEKPNTDKETTANEPVAEI